MNFVFYRGSFSRYSEDELEQRVIKNKLDINKIDNNMFTPLSYLANTHHHDKVLNLIENKLTVISWESLNKILSLHPILNSILYSNACIEKQEEILNKINSIYPLNQIKVKLEDLEKLSYLYIKKDNLAAYSLFKYFLNDQHIEKLNEYYSQKETYHHYNSGKNINLINSIMYDLSQSLEANNEKRALNCTNLTSLLIENKFNLCFFQEKENLYTMPKEPKTYNTLFSIFDNDNYLNSLVFLVQHLNFKDNLGSQFLEYWKTYKASSQKFNFKLEKINESLYLDALTKNYILNENQITEATIMVIKNNLDFNLLNFYIDGYQDKIEKMFTLYGNKEAFSIWQEKILLDKQLCLNSVNKRIKI